MVFLCVISVNLLFNMRLENVYLLVNHSSTSSLFNCSLFCENNIKNLININDKRKLSSKRKTSAEK